MELEDWFDVDVLWLSIVPNFQGIVVVLKLDEEGTCFVKSDDIGIVSNRRIFGFNLD